jgi:hypothetical protein
MSEIVADPCRPVITCFPCLESRNFNNLVLIPFCLARAMHAAGAGRGVRGPAPRTASVEVL